MPEATQVAAATAEPEQWLYLYDPSIKVPRVMFEGILIIIYRLKTSVTLLLGNPFYMPSEELWALQDSCMAHRVYQSTIEKSMMTITRVITVT